MKIYNLHTFFLLRIKLFISQTVKGRIFFTYTLFIDFSIFEKESTLFEMVLCNNQIRLAYCKDHIRFVYCNEQIRPAYCNDQIRTVYCNDQTRPAYCNDQICPAHFNHQIRPPTTKFVLQRPNSTCNDQIRPAYCNDHIHPRIFVNNPLRFRGNAL